jgi:very-short-patch-repair endonuclease/predicted transcriptional regulator of viral defense system
MRREGAKDRLIAEVANAQHGVVSRAQLLGLGLSDGDVDRRVRSGRLHRLHHGVYAVGHRVLTVEGRWRAAVLAVGSGAVLSHATAAAAWDLRRTSGGSIHVTVPGDSGRKRRPGIRIHRSITLIARDVTNHRGIPITTPARTIIDLARTLNGRPLEQALDVAEQRGLLDFSELDHRQIPPSLQAVLSLYAAGATATRSELEERFLSICDNHGIPRPQTNVEIEGHVVDFVWRARRLIVEVDGYAYHRSPGAFETDRERDVALTLAGWRVMRFTWRHITERPTWVASAIR